MWESKFTHCGVTPHGDKGAGAGPQSMSLEAVDELCLASAAPEGMKFATAIASTTDC